MNNSKLLESLASRLRDLDQMLEALGISNIHNAKQRIHKLLETETSYKTLKADLVEITGADNSGNALKAIRSQFNRPTATVRHRVLEVAPPHWVETMTPSQIERALNDCDRVLQMICERTTPNYQKELLDDLDCLLWNPEKSCRDVQRELMKELSTLSDNYREVEDTQPAGVFLQDYADTIFTRQVLTAQVIEEICSVPRTKPQFCSTEALDRAGATDCANGGSGTTTTQLIVQSILPECLCTADPMSVSTSPAFIAAFGGDPAETFALLNSEGLEGARRKYQQMLEELAADMPELHSTSTEL